MDPLSILTLAVGNGNLGNVETLSHDTARPYLCISTEIFVALFDRILRIQVDSPLVLIKVTFFKLQRFNLSLVLLACRS